MRLFGRKQSIDRNRNIFERGSGAGLDGTTTTVCQTKPNRIFIHITMTAQLAWADGDVT